MDLVAMNTMVAGYVQHGFVNEAVIFVEKIRSMGTVPNLVTWNTLIAGFSQANDDSSVAKLFQLVQEAGIDLDVIHGYSVAIGVEKDVFVRSALIGMTMNWTVSYLTGIIFILAFCWSLNFPNAKLKLSGIRGCGGKRISVLGCSFMFQCLQDVGGDVTTVIAISYRSNIGSEAVVRSAGGVKQG
ncbi:hypothetical protein L6452_28492 [Arctium lappa]|uniref:Uncharacterized protein n=1 Tax=Arctium lappa TaxID=4217 RepID=A0ACB8ZYL5_ARCLA|nr:hypothetical protein L6452_28492 [Arctium lappa]